MLVSIHVNSNKPENLKAFFDSYEKRANDPTSFEIIVNINSDDLVTKKYLDTEIKKRKFILRYISIFEGDYFSGHINSNNILKETNTRAYFITNVSDRAIVLTDNWDKILKQYINKYDDDLFRVNCSNYKNRKYNDFWECGFAPSNVFFATKKFIDITSDWAPCFSHDAFQQCLMYYLEKHDNYNAVQINRDIPENNLSFGGQTPEEKNDDDNYNRIHGQLKAWKILTSSKMQKEAKRRAMIIKANIMYHDTKGTYKIYDDNKKYIIIRDSFDNIIIKYKYSVNTFRIQIINFLRNFSYLNYCGSGFYEKKQDYIFSLFWYLNFRYKCLRGIKDLYMKYINI